MIDQLKLHVKRWFFFSTKISILLQGFFLVFNHFTFTEICNGLKLNNFGFKFQQVFLV